MNYIKRSQRWQQHLGFETLSPIQEQAYEILYKQRDLIARSQTGTGKSHAFLFPIFDLLDLELNQLQAIILTPTRELAMQLWQMAKVAQELYPEFNLSLVVGGVDRNKAITKLNNQPPHMMIGSIGRVNDLLKQGSFSLQNIKTIVLDEADMIWEFGFFDEVSSILNQLSSRVQLAVFSATLPLELQAFLRKAMISPTTIEIEKQSQYTPNIDYYLVHRKHQDYGPVIYNLLKTFVPAGLLIFANTRKEVAEIATYLRNQKIDLLELHGDVSSRARRQVLQRIQNDQVSILVCSDIAARGLDLPQVSHVISCGFPRQLEYFIHRAGRTGRMGQQGTCITLYNQDDLKPIDHLKSQGIKFHYKRIKDERLVDDTPFLQKVSSTKEFDPEIKAILNRKDVKVKPNYKKKRRLEIDKIKRRKRREMIKEDIQKQKISRAKAKQRQND